MKLKTAIISFFWVAVAAQAIVLFLSLKQFEQHPIVPPPAPLLPYEQMEPKFEVRSNGPSDFNIAFMAYNSTNWVVVTNKLPSVFDAECAVAETKMRLRIRYEIGQSLLKAWSENHK